MSLTGGDSGDSTVEQASAGGKIMVVDDDSANLRLLDFMLRQHGCEVRTYPRGAMALAAVEEDAPELILLDIDMPEMNGYEMCERLKSRPAVSEIPVIFMSALSETADKVKAFRSGAVDYVSKPFQFEEVHARVGAHIRLRRLQKQIENDNQRLQELVQVQVRQIAEAQMATIFAVAKLAEVRDGETGRHLERIQTLCRLLAAGLSEHPKYRGTVTANWIRNIFHASPLHDIGKVATPDRILLKPGPLTPEERAIMKAHAACGAETLEAVRNRYPDNEFLGMGIEVTRSHHEWWDGTGYPDGLAGEQIPLCARILAIVDCYDALRSSRRYKPSLPHDQTCAMILRDSGTHFDPTITSVFGRLSDQVRDVWDDMNMAAEPRAAHGAGPEDAWA